MQIHFSSFVTARFYTRVFFCVKENITEKIYQYLKNINSKIFHHCS
jgi:hypothetical protein